MRALGCSAALLVLAACPRSSPGVERRSTEFPTAKARVDFLCGWALCPTRPLDAAFHLSPHAEGGTVVHAVLKVPPAELSPWWRGCDGFTVEARPAWLPEVLQGTGWQPRSIPDTYRCGGEKRVVHAREGLVIRALLHTGE